MAQTTTRNLARENTKGERELQERLHQLEDSQRATLNLLEDFDEERQKLKHIQRATLNLLEDFDDEKAKLGEIQAATMNLLEDFDAERRKYQQIQRATVNLLEDMDEERTRLGDSQSALMNMLEDFEDERSKADQSLIMLEAVNRELEAFSYSVSHDLRAPLRAISGLSEAILEDYAPLLGEEGQRYFGLIKENAHSMGQLIDDLLGFSRLGRQEINSIDVDIQALARDVWTELTGQNQGRQIDFRMRPAPPVLGDRTLIRVVLMNLLSNAVKFTRPKAESIIEFGYTRNQEGGAFFVKDNGVGFDMKYVGKLFGVFQRLHSDTEFEGTGVGLATVYRIITRHGGRLWAEAELDKGATFYFTLPLSASGNGSDGNG